MWKSGNGVQYPWEWGGHAPDLTMGYRAPAPADSLIKSSRVRARVTDHRHTFQPDDHIHVSMLAGYSVHTPVTFASFQYRSLPARCKSRGVVTFMSNCAGFRMDAMRVLHSHLPVVVFGKCGPKFGTTRTVLQSHPECAPEALKRLMPAGLTTKHAVKFAQYYEKACVYRSYQFVLAFENAADPGYVSEKAYHALLAGAVPIYWGAPDARAFLPPGSAVFIDAPLHDLTAAVEQAARHLKVLGSDLKQYFLWKEQPVSEDFGKTIANQESGAYCRVCEAVAKRGRNARRDQRAQKSAREAAKGV